MPLRIYDEKINRIYLFIKCKELATFFEFPKEIRRLTYTTNTIVGYHRQLRKVLKNKSSFPTSQAVRKLLYLATMDITKKWTALLLRIAQADVSGVTIVIRGGDVKFGLVGQPTPQVLIQALEIVRNDILKAIAKNELEQETKQLEELAGEDIQELEQS
jgi:hypothetical protein